MNNEITVTVEGWVAKAPQQFQKGNSRWVVFRMGSTAWWRDAEGERHDAGTSWFDVKVSQPELAQGVLVSVLNGDPVIVTGRLSTHHWTDRDNNDRSSQQITARAVGHSLRWGTAKFTRVKTLPTGERVSSAPADDSPAAPPDAPVDDAAPLDTAEIPTAVDPAEVTEALTEEEMVEQAFNDAKRKLKAAPKPPIPAAA